MRLLRLGLPLTLLLFTSGGLFPSAAQPRDAVSPDLDVIYVPTPQPVVEEMLRLAQISDEDLLYDLGSGDGRIVITAAKEYGARGIGVDLDPQRIAESRANAEQAGVTDKVRFVQGDLFETDLRDATAVTLYLLHTLNVQLRPKLLRELRPGTPIVSHDFDMGEWPPDQTVRIDSSVVYMWIVPAPVEGQWQVSVREGGAERDLTLDLTQEFQRFEGVATTGREQVAVEEGRIAGEEIAFSIPTWSENGEYRSETFSGRIDGSAMQGVISRDGSTIATWSGKRLDDQSQQVRLSPAR